MTTFPWLTVLWAVPMLGAAVVILLPASMRAVSKWLALVVSIAVLAITALLAVNFKPETASAVLGSFGADISADKLYEMASKHGTSSVIDVEGRRGVSVEFIRSTTLTLATALTSSTCN